MSGPAIFLRHLAVIWRRARSSRVCVTEIVFLFGLLIASYLVFAFSFRDTLASYPWLPVLCVLPVFPWLSVEITPDAVRMRWWLGAIPLPFGCEIMKSSGRFECEESLDGNDAWTVDYSEGGLWVFSPFPKRLAALLNQELDRARGSSRPNSAPRAEVVKHRVEDRDA